MIIQNIIRKAEKMESLLFMLQDSAETGNMPTEVYADAFEIIRNMLDDLKSDISSMEVSAHE